MKPTKMTLITTAKTSQNFRIAYKVVGKYNRLGTNWVSAWCSLFGLPDYLRKIPDDVQIWRKRFRKQNLEHWTYRYLKGYIYSVPPNTQGFLCFEDKKSAADFIDTFGPGLVNLFKIIKVAGFGEPNYNIKIYSNCGTPYRLVKVPNLISKKARMESFHSISAYENLRGVAFKTIQVLE